MFFLSVFVSLCFQISIVAKVKSSCCKKMYQTFEVEDDGAVIEVRKWFGDKVTKFDLEVGQYLRAIGAIRMDEEDYTCHIAAVALFKVFVHILSNITSYQSTTEEYRYHSVSAVYAHLQLKKRKEGLYKARKATPVNQFASK